MNKLILDFEQAKSKHLLFKSRLRSILYDIPVEEGPVLSHYECSVGQWIYGHALKAYGHIPEMQELEMVHADIHITARKLVTLHKEGKTTEAKNGLSEMELVADKLMGLLEIIERKIEAEPVKPVSLDPFNFSYEEFHDLLRSNAELDKRIKEQIAENNESALKFDTVLAALSEGIVIQDAHGVLISVNHSAEKLLGLSAGQMRGMTSMDPKWQAIYEDGRPMRGEEHPSMIVLKTGKSVLNQLVGINRVDGALVWLSVNSQPLLKKDTGDISGVVSSFFDVTAIRKANAELRSSLNEQQSLNEELAGANEEQSAINEELISANEKISATYLELSVTKHNLQLAVDAGRIGTWHIVPDTRKLAYNSILADIFGYEGDETMTYDQAIGQVTEEHRPHILIAIEKAIADGGDYDFTYQQRRFNDGNVIWLRSLGKITPDSKGEYSIFSGVIIDITEQKQDEQRKNDFIGMVSHELKTPLTSLSGYLQLLKIKANKAEDVVALKMLDSSYNQVKKMTTMINGFLNVGRLESGKIHIDKQHFDLALLVKDMEEETVSSYDSHTIIFAPVITTFVDADRDKIGQVITNFISNAVKYSPRGSTINVACLTVNGHAEVSVRDQGMGINAEDREKLFERFYRVEGEQMRSISGFGIGLYLCNEIIKRHNGKIWVDSEMGKGSTFWFTLPVAFPNV